MLAKKKELIMLFRTFRISAQRFHSLQRIATLLVPLSLLLFFGPTALAATPDGPPAPAAPQQADDNALEVGTEWVQNYSACGLNNLSATLPDARGLGNKLTATNWILFFPYPTPRWSWNYDYGNSSVWETDFKRASAGGSENIYPDSVDFAYFSGHGSSNGFWFGTRRNDCQLTYDDASGAWGTGDLDWIGISACNVLDDPHLGDWANTMNGLRLVLGMKTVMADVPYGENVGNYLRWDYNFSQAWFRAADDLLPQTQIARVMAEDNAYFYDHWYNHNSFTVVDNFFSWWTHPAGSEPARAVDMRQLNDEMPVFQVAPLSLAEAQNRFNNLGAAFGVTTTQAIALSLNDNPLGGQQLAVSAPVSATTDLQLVMDTNNGLYNYTSLNDLWTLTSTVRAATATGMTAIKADDARAIADAFLNQNGLNRNDAQFYEVISDTLTTAQSPTRHNLNAANASQILAEQGTNYQVIYSRIITFTPVTAAGVHADPVEFSVMGPGSKLKVYVATKRRRTCAAGRWLTTL